MDDVTRLRCALSPVQEEARGLRWARNRPWRGQSHVWTEGELPVVDLHDLDARLARRAVQEVAGVAERLSCGAVCFVTGVGRHSIGPGRLGGVVRGELGRLRKERGWSWTLGAKGRLLLITDAARAPALATGRLPWPVWLLVGLLVAAAIYACLGAPR